MSVVVDASVVVKWFVEEPGSTEARTLLTASGPLIAPDLIIVEVASAAWKKVRLGEIGPAHADRLVRAAPLAFERLFEASLLAPRALEIARSLDHPVYDAFYVALAELRRAQLITDDTRLLSRLEASPWRGLSTALRA